MPDTPDSADVKHISGQLLELGMHGLAVGLSGGYVFPNMAVCDSL